MTSIIDILGNKQHPCFRVEINITMTTKIMTTKYAKDKKKINCISLDENQICWINTYFFRYTMEN